ncbi:MAG TPA: PAS domain-containing protein [Methanoregula sp.]|nr:PAS domain-containing protein [Methanoregula sp.]
MMRPLSRENEEVLHLFIIAAASIGAVISTVFSLTHGIFEIFPFLYILPIILSVYFFPKRAVLFSLGIGLTYMGLIYLYDFTNPDHIAIATAWFAIFITIGVVSSSYASRLLDEQIRIRSILDNSQDGIFCFDIRNLQIISMNVKCAQWLRYDRSELLGKTLALIWTEPSEREAFIADIQRGRTGLETEGMFRAKDGTLLRFVISAILVTRNRVLCSAIDITGSKIVDEEIRKTLEDLEEQVRARTAHLEKINAELQEEILERRRFSRTILSSEPASKKDLEDDE